MKELPEEIKKEGTDSFGRPVFSDSKGNLYVDVNISDRFGGGPKYCTKYRNEFDGEPDIPMPEDWKPKIAGMKRYVINVHFDMVVTETVNAENLDQAKIIAEQRAASRNLMKDGECSGTDSCLVEEKD